MKILVVEDNIKKALMETLKEGELKASCKQYKLSGTKSIKFDEKAFKADHPKEYDKYSTESVTFRLSKTKGDEIDE